MSDKSLCPACMMNIFKLAVNYPAINPPSNSQEYKDIVFLQNHLPETLHRDKSSNKKKFKVLLKAMREGGLPQRPGYSEHSVYNCPVYKGFTALEKRMFSKVCPCTYDELREAVTMEMERATLYFLNHHDQ